MSLSLKSEISRKDKLTKTPSVIRKIQKHHKQKNKNTRMTRGDEADRRSFAVDTSHVEFHGV